MALQLACVPVQGRGPNPDWIWTLHDGESVLAVSQAQWWTKDHALREGRRYARNLAAAHAAVAALKGATDGTSKEGPDAARDDAGPAA